MSGTRVVICRRERSISLIYPSVDKSLILKNRPSLAVPHSKHLLFEKGVT